MEKFQTMVNTHWQQLMLLRIKNKETGGLGLAKLLSLKMGAKLMLAVNLDIHDHLIKVKQEVLASLSIKDTIKF